MPAERLLVGGGVRVALSLGVGFPTTNAPPGLSGPRGSGEEALERALASLRVQAKVVLLGGGVELAGLAGLARATDGPTVPSSSLAESEEASLSSSDGELDVRAAGGAPPPPAAAPGRQMYFCDSIFLVAGSLFRM